MYLYLVTLMKCQQTLGKVHFTSKNDEVTTVDKTWKFVKDNAGKLRIVVHHSSLENKVK